MEWPWFCWRGRHSRDMGVTVEEYPPVFRAAQRERRVTLPGRSGSLGLAGEKAWDDVPLAMTALLRPGTRPADVTGWLSGAGDLVTGADPERVYFARLAAPLLVEPLSGGWHRAALRFICDPLKGRFPPEAPLSFEGAALAAGAAVFNPGDVTARPVFRVTGSGALTLRWGEDADAPRLRVDLRELAEDCGGFVFDSRILRVTSPDGTASLDGVARLENGEAEDFGLRPGANTLTAESEGGSVGGLTLEPRWRWL